MSKNYKGKPKQKTQAGNNNTVPAEDTEADSAGDDDAWETRAITSTTQPKISRRRPHTHCARPENRGTWPSRAPKSKGLSGACRLRAELRHTA